MTRFGPPAYIQHLLPSSDTQLTLDEVPWGKKFRLEVYTLTGQTVPTPWTQEQDGELTKVVFPEMEDNHPVYRLLVFLPPEIMSA
jgi:hypothetical protein